MHGRGYGLARTWSGGVPVSATAAGPGPSTRPTSPPHDRWQPGWGEAWLTVAAIFAVALAVRAITAAGITFPIPEDTTYYWGVARNLVEGRGLVTDAIWTYHTPPLVFPRPAFEIWLPLPTVLAAIPMAILGTGYDAASVAAVLVGAVVPVLTWRSANSNISNMRRILRAPSQVR